MCVYCMFYFFSYSSTVYKCWLSRFCQTYPQIDRNKIAFDNQSIIFTYGQTLPSIDQTDNIEKIMGPNRVGCEVEYEIVIKKVGNPIDLSSLHSLTLEATLLCKFFLVTPLTLDMLTPKEWPTFCSLLKRRLLADKRNHFFVVCGSHSWCTEKNLKKF